MFLDMYDLFHLTRAPNVRLPGGRPVFPGVPLSDAGAECSRITALDGGEQQVLDPARSLTVVSWRRLARQTDRVPKA